ncbi:MAG: hypothetical protein R3C09_00855 [Pirellulaceae bacterium]
MRGSTVQRPNLLMAMLLTAMAGGMGWGIRGQYGHQQGAMIAGVLVGLVSTLLFARRLSGLSAARVVAFTALGIAVGGSMTYGQTVGLTHDAPLVGNWEALRWGMLGLFIKGGIWIGLAGLFMGMSLGETKYPPAELALMLFSAVFLRFFGVQWLNEPYQPDLHILPWIYFSDSWVWEPNGELTPRREMWGGLLLALVVLTLYVRAVRHDILAGRMACIGFLAGGLGFSLGQCVQATHAWNPAWFEGGWMGSVAPYVNWWNMMETTFGAIFGAILALGLWSNQTWIRDELSSPEAVDSVGLSRLQEWLLLLLHTVVLIQWTFGGIRALGMFGGLAYTMIVIPLVASSAGRLWPYMVVFPLVLIPTAGKTLRQVSFQTDLIPAVWGWTLVVLVPVALALLAAVLMARRGQRDDAVTLSRWGLLIVTWFYFSLNFCFFEFPWPWQAWTGRTHSGLVFTVCAVCLSAACWWYGRRGRDGRLARN